LQTSLAITNQVRVTYNENSACFTTIYPCFRKFVSFLSHTFLFICGGSTDKYKIEHFIAYIEVYRKPNAWHSIDGSQTSVYTTPPLPCQRSIGAPRSDLSWFALVNSITHIPKQFAKTVTRFARGSNALKAVLLLYLLSLTNAQLWYRINTMNYKVRS
jgi:hypothetical protein